MKRELPDISTYLEHLRGLPFVLEVHVSRKKGVLDTGIDGEIRVETRGGPKTMVFQVKRSHLTRESAASIVHQARAIPRLLILAPVIGQDLGELFIKERVNYVDLAGNWHINLDDQYVAHAQGRTLGRAPRRERGLRVAAYRAIFALLVEPELINETTRTIAEKAGGLSPQTVTDVRHGLVERGLVLHARAGYRWTPGRRREVLDLLLAGFATTLWPTLRIATFRARTEDQAVLEKELATALQQVGGWRWGGGAAAHRLLDYYRGDRTIVYLLEPPPRDLVKRLHLVPDAAGNVVVARAPGPLAFSGPRSDSAHPLLVYADLLTEGNDRAREAAGVLRERLLKDLGDAA